MFKSFTIKNFRTHVETSLALDKGMALLIGSNNSGKSNLFAAIEHFSELLKRARLEPVAQLRSSDFLPHQHRLHTDKPIVFQTTWVYEGSELSYELTLFAKGAQVLCKTKISLEDLELETIASTQLGSLIEYKLTDERPKKLLNRFFRDLSAIYAFNFQPTLLKADAGSAKDELKPESLNIATALGREGSQLQTIVQIVYQQHKAVYDRFVLLMRKFVDSFYGITVENGQTYWQFDLNKTRIPSQPEAFLAEVVSDGLLKAAAIALLSAMPSPPSLILLEEIENGTNQKNIQHLIAWLSNITQDGQMTQVIATTHSPSVLREFVDSLDSVFYVALLPKGFRSVVSDLNALLINDVKAGRIEGDIAEINGKELVQVEPLELIKLFYMGIIGGI